MANLFKGLLAVSMALAISCTAYHSSAAVLTDPVKVEVKSTPTHDYYFMDVTATDFNLEPATIYLDHSAMHVEIFQVPIVYNQYLEPVNAREISYKGSWPRANSYFGERAGRTA